VNGDTTLLFGLSGTGKTTLSSDPHRKLIGDDEHGWSDEGLFNLEGGCYAKCINLSREKEPEIYDAIRFGSILENIEFYPGTRNVNYDDASITENTRCSYPLENIPSAKIPSVGGHPKNVIFLTCDAYGVLPPVSKMTPEQTMYHFISGYTAKVAGTEIGIKEPQPTFSACFGEAFLTRHPSVYAEMLADKLKKHVNTWLINTGWTGGKYGIGHRMDLPSTRAIIDSIHNGDLDNVETETLPVFNLQVPKHCKGVDENILIPKNTWTDKADYDKNLRVLAEAFVKNFKKYEGGSSDAIKQAGPQLD
jgi:phosphoenolpyruvate carboxykinase (ATP)